MFQERLLLKVLRTLLARRGEGTLLAKRLVVTDCSVCGCRITTGVWVWVVRSRDSGVEFRGLGFRGFRFKRY